ncbi:MAG: HPr(Ser) kinase/phosphatase [Myxococcales bacterium]|nr:HPr(Ser) kinase/phosphatase [Myxococcales bacterium]
MSVVVVLVDGLLREEGLGLELVAGRAGLGRRVTAPRIQKPGLALTGYTEHVHPERLQVLGLTEIAFLETLTSDQRRAGLEALCAAGPAALVITRGLAVPAEAAAIAEKHGVPLMITPLMSSVFISRVTRSLEDQLAPTTGVHGVLIDVLGVGILILGKSGIGKSEAALDLVMRGHRLVADDIVEIHRRGMDTVYGGSSEIIKHHMEIRGLGIINVKDLFGISAVRDAKKIELVAELMEWNEEEEYDRLGTEELRHLILEVPIAMIRVPIRPGRNIASILEVAARNQLLKFQGKHSARDFAESINRAIAEAVPVGRTLDEVE